MRRLSSQKLGRMSQRPGQGLFLPLKAAQLKRAGHGVDPSDCHFHRACILSWFLRISCHTTYPDPRGPPRTSKPVSDSLPQVPNRSWWGSSRTTCTISLCWSSVTIQKTSYRKEQRNARAKWREINLSIRSGSRHVACFEFDHRRLRSPDMEVHKFHIWKSSFWGLGSLLQI